MFWTHLSRICKPTTLPFNKLNVNNTLIASQKEITKELSNYYSMLFRPTQMDLSDTHNTKIALEFKEILQKMTRCDKKIKTNQHLRDKKYYQRTKIEKIYR
jgi:hypothetical protein